MPASEPEVEMIPVEITTEDSVGEPVNEPTPAVVPEDISIEPAPSEIEDFNRELNEHE